MTRIRVPFVLVLIATFLSCQFVLGQELVGQSAKKRGSQHDLISSVSPGKVFATPATPKSTRQLGNNGTIDAKLMKAAFGVDPISLGMSQLESFSAKKKFATAQEIEQLPTIESFQFPKRETVCERDNRFQVTPTTVNPWHWNCMLVIEFEGGFKARGSGWLVGPRTVITAGHCVHGGGPGGKFATRIEVIPGMDGKNRPYGTFLGRQLYTTTGWANNRSFDHDYGAIILGSEIGNRVGYFGFENLTRQQLLAGQTNVAGYPGDKPIGTQWRSGGPLVDASATQLFYTFDTYAGQSGSPLWKVFNNQRTAVGIHNLGGCPNAGVRINQQVFANIDLWKNRWWEAK